MIDLRDVTEIDADGLHAVLERSLASTPPEPLLFSERTFNLVAVEGREPFCFVRDTEVPVCSSTDAAPAPRVFDLEAEKAAKAAGLAAAIQTHVDTHVPPQTREMLIGLLLASLAKKVYGLPVNDAAVFGLLGIWGWMQQAMAYSARLKAEVAACKTLYGLTRIQPDYGQCGEPPTFTVDDFARVTL